MSKEPVYGVIPRVVPGSESIKNLVEAINNSKIHPTAEELLEKYGIPITTGKKILEEYLVLKRSLQRSLQRSLRGD